MELSLLSMFAYATPLFIFVPIISYVLMYKRNHHSNLPPGNWSLPFIGENIQFFLDSKKGWPEKFILERMSRFSALVFKTSLLGEQMMVFCGPQGNKFLFSNTDKLVTTWMPKSFDKLLPRDNETWDEHLKIGSKVVVDVLRPESFNRFANSMDTIAQRHFGTLWEGKEQVHVHQLSKRFTFSLACQLFLSIDDPEEVAKLSDQFETYASGLISLPIDLPGTSFNRGLKASGIIRKQFMEIIRQREREIMENRHPRKQDLLSHLLSFVDENGEHLSETSLITKILGAVFAGYDTASTAITTTVKYLAELPHIYDQVYKEQMEILRSKEKGELLNWEDIQKMQYSWNVICEAMRLAAPAQGTFRVAIADFKFGGFSIPAGSKIYWTVNSTHKNPEYFPNPDKFDPSRFEGKGPAAYTYVPFGGGPRKCKGIDYARLEILGFIHNIVKRFKWEKLIPDEEIVINPLPKPTHGLPIRLFPHEI